MKTMWIFAVVFTCTAPVAQAKDTFCRFSQECFETEACSETSFEMTMAAGPDGDVQLITEAETIDAFKSGDPEHGFVIGFGGSAMHVLSAAKSGQARYSVHLAGPMLVSYHGICEVGE
ncbi:MAG: hypothetical protein AB8B51_21815, partial [Sedimentitalea sp.]